MEVSLEKPSVDCKKLYKSLFKIFKETHINIKNF